MVKNTIFGVVVLVVIVALIATAGSAALVDGAKPTQIDDEPIVVDYDAPSTVDVEGVEYSETVNITVNGGTVADGTDYNWYPSNGTVVWENTAPTADGDNGTIDYTAYQVTDSSRKLAQISAALLIGAALVAVWIIGEIAISGRF